MLDSPHKTTGELIKELLVELREKGIAIDEFRLQKLIYKIKMSLGKDHELYDELPFYWYRDGPYSEVVADEFKHEQPNLITENGFSILKDNCIAQSQLLQEFPQIKEELNIVENRDYFFNQMDKDIYKDHEPYLFMHKYKYRIYNPVKNKTLDIGNEELIDKLYFCQGDLPIKGYFYDFKLIYSTFTTNIDLLNDCGNFDKHWEELEKIILDIWETFSKGLRVITKDTYYNNYTEKWDKEFKNALTPLENFYDLGKKYDYRITDITAEGKDNAISKEVTADIVVAGEHYTTDMAMLIKETETKMIGVIEEYLKDLSGIYI